MRLTVVASYYKPAYVYGGGLSLCSAYETLARRGVDVTVLTTAANGRGRLDVPLDRPVDVDGVTVWYHPVVLAGGYFYSPSLAAASWARLGEADLAILDCLWGHALAPAAGACTASGVPFVVPLHGQLLPWALSHKGWKKRPYLAAAVRRHLERAAALHCTDPDEAAAAADLGLRVPAMIAPYGVDAARFASLPPRGRLRNRWGIPPSAALLLFLGRLHVKKRPDVAVQALAAARAAGQDAHLVLAGPDQQGLGPSLQAQAERLRCADRVHLVGMLRGDDLLQVLADADLMLMPSAPRSENFGMSAAEALASGLPVLASDGVPVALWAEREGAGRALPGDADAFVEDFADATRDLLDDPRRLRAMGERGRDFIRRRFDLSAVADELLANYRAIRATGRPAATPGGADDLRAS